MKTILVLFDSRFATSIASAAIVKAFVPGSVSIDTSQELNKRLTANRKSEIKTADEVYVMIDDSEFKTGKEAKVHYIKKGKAKDARRVLAVWNKLTNNAKVPLVIHYLGNVRLSEEQVTARKYVKNSIPSYLRKLEEGAMGSWNRLFREPQDVALLTQLVANGQIIEDYLEQFGDKKTDKVSASELRASEAKLAKLEDQDQKIAELEKELEEEKKECELRGNSIENYASDKADWGVKVEALESKLEKEEEDNAKTKLNLKNALADAGSAKSNVASKTKEIAQVRQSLKETEPILKKEKDAHLQTQKSLSLNRDKLAVEIKKVTEARSDYDKEVVNVVTLEKKVGTLTTAAKKQEKDSANAASKAAKKISDLNTEIVKLSKSKK